MKKVYKAPEILFESFMMSTNIAGDCENTPNTYATYNSCGLYYSNKIVFAIGLTGCTGLQISEDQTHNGQPDGICYHVPSVSNNIFNS